MTYLFALIIPIIFLASFVYALFKKVKVLFTKIKTFISIFMEVAL